MSTLPQSPLTSSRRELNKAARREAIVKAATTLFGRGSYATVQMDDVAKAAAIGKPALYRYFSSKEELFLEVSDRALRRLEQRLVELNARGLRPGKTLARMVELLVEALRQHFASLRLLTGEHPVLANRWRLLFRNRRRAINATLSEVLRRGVTEGEFRPLDATIAPGMIIGMIRGAVMEAPGTPTKRIAAAAIPLVLGGVQRRPSTHARGRRP
jgi:AcrR family transcriptional regulator